MCEFKSLNNSTSRRVLNLLEPVKFIVRNVVIDRITLVKFRIDSGRNYSMTAVTKYEHFSVQDGGRLLFKNSFIAITQQPIVRFH